MMIMMMIMIYDMVIMMMILHQGNSDDGNGDLDEVNDDKGGRRPQGGKLPGCDS